MNMKKFWIGSLMAILLLALLTTVVFSTTIATWDIDVAKITPEKHSGQITITVEYKNGTSSTVRFGYNRLGGIWKVANSSAEP
jgi:hypothetical protein